MYGLALELLVVLLKWVVIRRYPQGTYWRWSFFYLRWWFIDRLVAFTMPYFMVHLKGTPLMSLWLRMLGSDIGRDVVVNTTGVHEFDLVTMEDGVELNGCTGTSWRATR